VESRSSQGVAEEQRGLDDGDREQKWHDSVDFDGGSPL
jgi:hypothetical protein